MPLLNGLVIAVLAVVLVVVRVLWPKDTLRRRREKKLFQQSVQEMLEGLDKLEDERYDEALTLFKLAAAETPNKPAPVLLRIYVMGLQGQQREARLELRQALQRWPIGTLPKRLLALAYLGAGQYDRAYASAVAAASEDPPSSAAMRTLGDVCRLVERYPESERAYLNAVKLGAPRPYAGLTWVLAAQGRVEDAELELARAPDRVLAMFEGQLALAQIHLQARRLQDAIDIYRALLQRYRNVPRILVPYGVALLEAHQIGKAHDVLARAANESEEDPFAHCALATVLFEQNDLAAAVAHVREALRLWPGYGSARGVYGDVLKRAGRYDAAEEQYREALRLNPFLPYVHLRLAALLRSKGEEDAAREHEREAARLRPEAPLPITQEILAVTTEHLATGMLPVVKPRLTPRPAPPSDIDLEVPITNPKARANGTHPEDAEWPDENEYIASSMKLPGLRHRDAAATPPLTAFAPLTPTPIPSSDIAVYPGAVLLLDESSVDVFSQTLQVNSPPRDVMTFYHHRMSDTGWHFVGQERSAYNFIDGVTLQYRRGQQIAYITIGIPLAGRQSHPLSETITYIVTAISHDRQSYQRMRT